MRKFQNSFLTHVAIILALCLFAAGCSKSANTNSNTALTKSSPAPQLSVAPETSADSSKTNQSKVSNPEDAAKRFYDAWKKDDRAAALSVASETAVKELFKNSGKGSKMEFMGCEKEGKGSRCSYYYEGGGLHMLVDSDSSVSYQVKSIEFIAD